MKGLLLLCCLVCCAAFRSEAQTVDSIEFHLYTDSLKKGVYNYINVDGKLSNGRWLPLDSKQIKFSSSAGTWDGNSLILEPGYGKDSVVITASLKQNPQLQKSITIFMKRRPDNEVLKTEQEIMNEMNSGKRKGRRS